MTVIGLLSRDGNQEHVQALKLQGYARKTVEAYSRAIRRLVDRTSQLPKTLTPNDLKTLFTGLVKSHSWAWSTVKFDRNGIQFFWEHVLKKEWDWIKIVKPPKERNLMGLRLGEGLHLKVGDIDSKRMVVHIRRGKGGKDRYVYVPLPDAALVALRKYWRTLRYSYATHLLESGINLCLIQEYLEHRSPITTARYTRMNHIIQTNAGQILNNIMSRYLKHSK